MDIYTSPTKAAMSSAINLIGNYTNTSMLNIFAGLFVIGLLIVAIIYVAEL